MDSIEARTLITRKQELTDAYLAGGISDFMGTMTSLLDEYFFTVYEKSITARKMVMSGNPFAVIALGGYGRKEQCIHSDIDLLILFKETVPPEVESFVQELLYPLWDARFEVGYAVRTIDECLSMSFERFDILTTVLDARFICGASLIYSGFTEAFRKALSGERLKQTLTYLFEHGTKRLEDYGDSTYLVAPDLKSGFGGLRDYHTLLWYAKIKSHITTHRDLEYYGFLSHFEYQSLEEALAYIWDARNRLHHITGRKCDTLHFEYQAEVAALMGMDEKQVDNVSQVEAFLGALHGHMEFLKQINQITFEDILTSGRVKADCLPSTRPAGIPGLEIRKRRLHFANTVVILQHPALLLEIFLESGRTRIPLSIEARRVVSEFLHLVDGDMCTAPEGIKIFKRLLALSFWEFNVLNVMLATGILEKFIPEFSAIKDKIQYNHYHLFPVDKHSIRCVQILNSFRTPGEGAFSALYADVFKEVRNKNLLLTVGLLHDIGKSDPAKEHSKSGARMARPILERLDFSKREVEDGTFLIRNHLLMAKTATRRDISDEETAIYMADKVGKIRLLRMLFLLTVADSQATGPKAWNDWTESLVKELFLKTLNILKGGELATQKTRRLIEGKKAEVMALAETQGLSLDREKDLGVLGQRYLLNVSAHRILSHVQLHQDLGNRDFIWKVSREEGTDIRTVTVCGRERPGFYSKIAGVFFMNNIDVVASQAYPMGDHHILDIFKVAPPKDRLFETEKWEKAEADLVRALKDDTFLDRARKKIPTTLTLPPGKQPAPSQVRIDNETSSFFTIIEVLTYDYSGLLFTITDTFYRNGLNVNVAVVGTKVDQVIDTFYVRDLASDHKIESQETLNHIKQTIISRLPSAAAKGGKE